MSQVNNGAVLRPSALPLNPVIDTGERYHRPESDLVSTFIMNDSPTRIGYETGLGLPTFTGLAAGIWADDFFERDIAGPAKAYFKDVPGLDSDPKTIISWYENNFKEIKEMNTELGLDYSSHSDGYSAYKAMSLAYGQYKAEKYYTQPFENLSSVGVGLFAFGAELVGDPTNWIGAGLSKMAVKNAAKQVATKAGLALAGTAVEGAVTNAVQTFAMSVESQDTALQLWGLTPNRSADYEASLAGGLFGALLPLSIAGVTAGVSRGTDAALKHLSDNIDKPGSFVNTIAKVAGVPVLRNAPIDHLKDMGEAVADAEVIAGSHKYLYNDAAPDSTYELALTKMYWDDVANTGVTPKDYASWLLRSKPSKEESTKFVNDLLIEAQRVREAEANGGQSPAVAKAHKDLQEQTIKIGNAFVDLEDPEVANRGAAWMLSNVKKSLTAGGATPEVSTEQSLAIMAMVAGKAASKDMGVDEWIARNISGFTIDKHPKTGETLFSIRHWDVSAPEGVVPSGFFSQVVKTIQYDMKGKMRVGDFLKWLLGRPDIKKDEVDWMLGDFLKNVDQSTVVSSQDILDKIVNHRSRPYSVSTTVLGPDNSMYSSYLSKTFSDDSIEGYQEVLFTLPPSETFNVDVRAPHWNRVPNIVASGLIRTVKDESGKQVLHIEEIQSDLHQIGRKQGYASLETREDGSIGIVGNETDRRTNISHVSPQDKPPLFPYTDTYYELVLKWALQNAAARGIDRVTINPGITLHRRWGGELKNWELYYDGKYLKALEKLGKKYGFTVDKNSVVRTGLDGPPPKVDTEEVKNLRSYRNLMTAAGSHKEDIKDLVISLRHVEDILESYSYWTLVTDPESGEIYNPDGNFEFGTPGGDPYLWIPDYLRGALLKFSQATRPDIGYADNLRRSEELVNSLIMDQGPGSVSRRVRKLLNRLGDLQHLNTNHDWGTASVEDLMDRFDVPQLPFLVDIQFRLKELLDDVSRKFGKTPPEAEQIPVHSVTLGSEASSKLNTEGVSLFQKNPQSGKVQAAVTFSTKDGRAIIRAFTGATNFSSLVHELGHIFRRDLDPEQQAAADAWVGSSKNTKWTVQQEEKFARGFEKWLRTRKSNDSVLDSVFQKMKNWMTQIYQTIKGSPLDHVRLNDEIIKVFESMFSKPGEIPEPGTGPKVERYGTGRVKVRISGDIERALIGLHKAKTPKDRYALVAWLREKTGMDDNEILTASRFMWSELRSRVREAKAKLRAKERPSDVRVSTHGTPYVVVELGDFKKVYDPEELGSIKHREQFPKFGEPTTIERLQADLAAAREEQDKLEYSGDGAEVARVRRNKNTAARRLAKAVAKFFPQASGRIGEAAVVGDIDSGIVELTAGTKLDDTQTARVLVDRARHGFLDSGWLVFNSTKAVKTLRKLGNLFSTGHLETVGSDNPIVARLSRLVSEGNLYRDAFGPTKLKSIGLQQHRHRVKAQAGDAVNAINRVLKDVDPAVHQEIGKMAMAIAADANYVGLTDPMIVSKATEIAGILKKYYEDYGIRGIQNGYFRNTIDNYGGTFHILGTKRKPKELADALFSVWKDYFTKEDAPIHRRTFKSIPSIQGDYGAGGPKNLKDLIPSDRDKYLKALLDDDVRNGLFTTGLRREAQLVTNNKLGHTELKELITHDALALVHSDPSLSRQINVDVWFDPRLSEFVDWNPNSSILKYLEVTGYRIREQGDVNKVVRELLGYDRRDIDAVGLVRGIRDVLLADDKLADADRAIIEQSFGFLENQVNTLRGHVNRDYTRFMGAMDTVANVTMNLGRTGVAARSAMAGLSTEIIPMLLATTVRHPSMLLPILRSTLGGLSKFQLKGLIAGYNHMFTHRPDLLNTVANLESINTGWLDKTFINPWKQFKASMDAPDSVTSMLGSVLTQGTSMLHRMSSGLGGEDFFQKMATNIAALQTTFRISEKFDKMRALGDAIHAFKDWSKDPVAREKQFRELARKHGFGDDPNWAAKLHQSGLLDKEWLDAMTKMDALSGGKILGDTEGAFNQNTIEKVIGVNAESAKLYQEMNDRLLRFVETDIRTRVTMPDVQDSNIPKGGLDPITRMAQMFMSFQRSWFHNALLQGVSNARMVHALSYLGTMLVGEFIYYYAYRMLYRGDSWEDIEEEWKNNPTVMIAEGVARTNLFGSASAIGQIVMDVLGEHGSSTGSIYSLKVAGNLFKSTVNLTKATLSKDEVDPADARRVELMTAGLNAWWMRPIYQVTGYDSFSEWLFKHPPAS